MKPKYRINLLKPHYTTDAFLKRQRRQFRLNCLEAIEYEYVNDPFLMGLIAMTGLWGGAFIYALLTAVLV